MKTNSDNKRIEDHDLCIKIQGTKIISFWKKNQNKVPNKKACKDLNNNFQICMV